MEKLDLTNFPAGNYELEIIGQYHSIKKKVIKQYSNHEYKNINQYYLNDELTISEGANHHEHSSEQWCCTSNSTEYY